MNLIFNVSLVNIYITIKKKEKQMTNITIVILAIITAVTIESVVYRICTHIERK